MGKKMTKVRAENDRIIKLLKEETPQFVGTKNIGPEISKLIIRSEKIRAADRSLNDQAISFLENLYTAIPVRMTEGARIKARIGEILGKKR